MHAWVGFAFAALVLWGITGVTQKLATNRISSERSFVGFGWAMVALAGLALAVARPGWRLTALAVTCSVAGGALNGLGAWTSFRALESGGKASIVISLIALYPLLTVALAMALLGERLTATQCAGAVAAIAAAILLSLEPETPRYNLSHKPRRSGLGKCETRTKAGRML